MQYRNRIQLSNPAALAMLLLAVLATAGCASAALTAAILAEQQKESKVSWSGQVLDTTGLPVEGVAVQISSDRQPENIQAGYGDLTDADGKFSLKFPYHQHALYSVTLVYGEQSTQPVFYQRIFIEKADRSELVFAFDVERPEQQFSWTGVLGEGEGTDAYIRVNAALVMLQLGEVDNPRRFWARTGDGGVFQFPYTWNQQGSYTLEVLDGGSLRRINSHQFSGSGADQSGVGRLDGDPLLEAQALISPGPHHNALRVDPLASPPETPKAYRGRVRYADNNAALADALVILCLGGETGSPRDIRLSERGNLRYFWASTDELGSFEIAYDLAEELSELEIVVDGHVLSAPARLNQEDGSIQEFSIDLAAVAALNTP